MEMLFGLAIMLSAPLYVVLQVVAAVTARTEGERVVALLPLLISAPLAVWCGYAYTQDSNLWPLGFILFSPLGVGYLLVAMLVRSGRRSAA
jgi:hypothetical protein